MIILVFTLNLRSVCEDAYLMCPHSTNPDEDDIDVIMNKNELYREDIK